jgi:hypothetical protein
MKAPAGQHKIEFKFYPKAHYIGIKIALASSILILLLILGVVGMVFTGKKLLGMEANTKDESIYHTH